jgi:hypothetical protein
MFAGGLVGIVRTDWRHWCMYRTSLGSETEERFAAVER